MRGELTHLFRVALRRILPRGWWLVPILLIGVNLGWLAAQGPFERRCHDPRINARRGEHAAREYVEASAAWLRQLDDAVARSATTHPEPLLFSAFRDVTRPPRLMPEDYRNVPLAVQPMLELDVEMRLLYESAQGFAHASPVRPPVVATLRDTPEGLSAVLTHPLPVLRGDSARVVPVDSSTSRGVLRWDSPLRRHREVLRERRPRAWKLLRRARVALDPQPSPQKLEPIATLDPGDLR